MQDGMNLDPQIQVQVLQSKLAEAAIREAQLEVGVQQLLMEKQALLGRLEALEGVDVEVVED